MGRLTDSCDLSACVHFEQGLPITELDLSEPGALRFSCGRHVVEKCDVDRCKAGFYGVGGGLGEAYRSVVSFALAVVACRVLSWALVSGVRFVAAAVAAFCGARGGCLLSR